ncbi:MAG: type I glyceraldehyde-3-phosphate dehydrogenase [Armatimonadota bacterium]
MAIRVGINGFGRIGRLVLRGGFDREELKFVAVNDIADTETLAYLLQFDSVHGLSDFDVAPTDEGFSVDGRDLAVFNKQAPSDIPWRDLGVQLVIEASGHFTKREEAAGHLAAGASKVVITAPAHGADATFVYGINDDAYDPGRHHVVSTASCTTNALAIVTRVLHDSFGIDKAFALAVHAYTNSQALLDQPVGKLRRARAAALNLVPTTTGAARTIDEVVPEVKGRLSAMAIRTPNPDGSLLDVTALLQQEVDADAVNEAFYDASETERLQEVLLVSNDPLVSTDIVGVSFTAIVDAESTQAMGNMAKVLTWYDNEWGYSMRVVDMAAKMAGIMLGS